MFASGTVRLLATAVLTGDIEAPRVAIDEGAVFDGQIRMRKKAGNRQQRNRQRANATGNVGRERAIPELATVARKPLIRKTS